MSSTDMESKLFENTSFGRIALRKMGAVAEDFRLYRAWWSEDRSIMTVVGARFRRPTKGANKGKLCKMISHTQRRIRVTANEIVQEEKV